MVKLLSIIKKDFKILIRSKSSALIVLVGPLLLILLVGSAFNTSSFTDIKIGTYSESYNELTNSIISKLEGDNYKITKLDNEDNCIGGVKSNTINICIVFPADLNPQSDEEIELYVDQSRINLVYAIKGAITAEVAEKSKEVSEDLTGIIVNQLALTNEELKQKRELLMNVRQRNNEMRAELSNMEGSLISLKLNFSEAQIILSEIDNKTSDLKAELNTSLKDFENLEDLVTALKAEMKAYDDLSSKRDEILTKFPELSSSISTSNEELQDVKDSTDTIVNRIEAIEVTDIDSIVSPIKAVTKPISKEKTHINYLFPTLIMMVVMFVSLLLSSVTVIREKISAAYFRNYISPTNGAIFVLATYLTNILIIIIQLIIVFGVMMSLNPALSSTVVNVSLALLLITTTFILLGMIVGYLFSSEETATIGAISLGTILLFFSNTIIPLETISYCFK